ncbi:related to meiotically up-regulated gene 161 protein [Cephalotrichum gorgonifer]|uniref:Related to meiotically up-regulated gene 161 protein n=1 Tax=Cephalotrichum gorgonifer TaxID=2041049 RepID=A0AAE8SR42_9PEZI|nr:related to meiotically up-regulated gene 161 protein [Cephalotrichum gorgonifer]
MDAPKVLVLGSVDGQLEAAFARVGALHAKNNFSLVLITGNLFGEDGSDDQATALLNGNIKIPLPTYFTVATRPLPPLICEKIEKDEEICENLHFLGKRSVTKTSEGVRIVTLGGQLDETIVAGLSTEQHLPFHTAQDATSLRGAQSADILLTTMWPLGITKGSHVPLGPDSTAGPSSKEVAMLCSSLKPRYHFSASPQAFFWEREPFLHEAKDQSEHPRFTRFISMALFGNANKAKAIYAFTLPRADTSVEIPPGTTASPFASLDRGQKKRPHDGSYSRFQHDDRDHRHSKHKRRREEPPPGPDKCFFCLSNPNLSAHMCCAIGDDSYLATAKGPLPASDTFAKEGLNFPGHFIIIPLAHAPTTVSMGDVSDPQGTSVKTYKEMSRFRESLQAMLAKVSGHKLGAVTWEISRGRGIHLHWQFVATPVDMIRSGLVEAGFKVEAENHSYPEFQEKDLTLEEEVEFGDFFRVWIWADDGEDKIKGKCLVMPLEPESRFDLQLGRRVMAKLLGLESRAVWQNCVQDEEEETKDVAAFREAFKEWDFTMT